MFAWFRSVALLKSELARAIMEKALVVEECDRETDRAEDLAEELEQAWRDCDAAREALANCECDRLKHELCDALRDRDRARAALRPEFEHSL
jgi:hypothetical protein